MKKITLKNIEDHSSNTVYSFAPAFFKIIKNELLGYSGTTKEKLKSFLGDMKISGCQGGMIAKFVYNKDCQKFYIKHIDELEEYIFELEKGFGDFIKNSKGLPRYTFVVWLAFEEFCNDIYFNIFENE